MVESSFSAGGRNKVIPGVRSALGEYRLEQLLERNEAGPVFLARHEAGGAKVRLRVLEMPADLEAEARIIYLGYFQKQANRVTELAQAYILPLASYGVSQGLPYLAYPHFQMTSLSNHLAQYGPMDMSRAGKYLDQIAEALECGQQHDILHRNLSTDNVFLKQDGSIVVADFGLLHMLEQRGDYQPGVATARRDQLFGMNEASAPAPEQIAGGAVDAYTDVYALGAVLYRMLSGHRVFRGKTREEIAQQHLNAPVPPLSAWRRDLPAALDGVIARAMAKDARQRFARAGELANAYHQVVAPHDTQRKAFVATPAPTLSPLVSERPAFTAREKSQAGIPRRKAIRLLVAGGSAAAAITVVAIVGIHSLQGNATPGVTATTPAQSGSTPAAKGSSNGGSPSAGHQGRVLARTSDIATNSDKTFALPNNNNPGLLIHLPDNRFVAFDSTCTHAGCAVSYNAQNHLLQCPCHQAVFDPSKNAAVVSGPAPSPLTSIPISVNGDGTITTTS